MLNYLVYQTLQTYQNTTGSADLGTVFCYDNSIVPFVSLVILIPLFIIITLSTFFATKSATGRGDFVASITAGSFVETLGAGILSVTNCMGTNVPLVSGNTLVISIGIFVVCAIVLFVTRE